MLLTDFQKKIIKSIVEEKVTDINSFIDEHCQLEKRIIKPHGRHPDPYKDELTKSGEDKEVYVPKDEEKNIDRIKDYLLTLKILEKQNLIFFNKKDDFKKDRKSIYIDNPNVDRILPNNSIFNIINTYYNQEIVFTPELKNFVEKGFLTSEEQLIIDEKKDRVRAQRLTLIVAVFSILGTMATTAFQYFTYTNERVVTVKNRGAFSDTLNVKIIETTNTGRKLIDKDSTEVLKTKTTKKLNRKP